MSIGVNISSFKLKKKNSKKNEFLPFYSDLSIYKKDGSFECQNIIDIIKTFYTSKLLPEQLPFLKKYFCTKKDSLIIEEIDNRIFISFTILCGTYGVKSNITNIDTHEVKYKRKIDDADVKDFRIMLAFEKNCNKFNIYKGVILFEVIGQYGVKTLTTKKIREFMSNSFNIMPFFNSLSTKETISKLVEEGNLKTINLIKNEVAPKFSNIFGINSGKEKRTVILSSIKKKDHLINKLVDLATSNNEVYEFDDEYDDLSITFDIAGRTKTTNIKDINSIYLVEPLPDDVLDVDGGMNISKMNIEMMKYANNYLDNLVEGEEIDD